MSNKKIALNLTIKDFKKVLRTVKKRKRKRKKLETIQTYLSR